MNKTILFNENLCKEVMFTAKQRLFELKWTLDFSFQDKLWDKPKKMTKYNFSRTKWYVTSRFGSHENFLERVKWCEEQFGPEPKNHDAWSRWYTWFGVIKFRDAQDYEWFMLRWS